MRGELYQFQGASRAGELAAKVAKSWIGSTVPTISREVAKVANRWQPAAPQLDNLQLANLQLDKRELAQHLVSSAPMFIIYQTAAGNEVAVPIAQARNFTDSQSTVATNRVSPEFQQIVNTANARLKWAGGRFERSCFRDERLVHPTRRPHPIGRAPVNGLLSSQVPRWVAQTNRRVPRELTSRIPSCATGLPVRTKRTI